jgi:hypothetical protein
VVGRREVSKREKLWGKKKRLKKPKLLGRGGCVFGSFPKWLEWPHLQLVH